VPVLDFDRAPAPKKPKNLRRLLGLGTFTALIGIGVAFAQTAGNDFDSEVEFGQGIAAVAACDPIMTITPISEFKNSSSPSEATHLMKTIKVSGVDLTPEGWDVTLNNGAGDWHPDFFADVDPELRTWNPDGEQHPGQYFDGEEWVPTCEGKVLLLRAFTNQSAYEDYTVGDDTNTPLWLNRLETNAGIGVRVFYLPASEVPADVNSWVVDVFAWGDYGSTNFDTIDITGTWGAADPNWYETDINLHLTEDDTLPPVDSRWVNKITIESTAKGPNGWAVRPDFFSQLE
jgi:hypothetical protein